MYTLTIALKYFSLPESTRVVVFQKMTLTSLLRFLVWLVILGTSAVQGKRQMFLHFLVMSLSTWEKAFNSPKNIFASWKPSWQLKLHHNRWTKDWYASTKTQVISAESSRELSLPQNHILDRKANYPSLELFLGCSKWRSFPPCKT